ncbi:MAG: nucleotide exchange factor GrpE [Proteobacteria bacterium]|nr:nucleotide exchange factor GrpE [Pseudomonadota bacterium]MBI3498745.1 nucleotide exchange factor GrpE [Pseudomonadota bacterium]
MTDEPKQDTGSAAGGEPGGTTPANDAGAAGEGLGREAALDAEIAKLKDQLLRALAEAENVRRRAERERDEAKRFGAVGLARDVLAVADNLRRALELVPPGVRKENEVLDALLVGIEGTERQLLSAFDMHAIKRVEPVGEPFDYNLHQAMFEVENSGKPAGTVVQVLQPGYVLHDRLLRAAMVGVAKGAAPEQEKTAHLDETA